ncbi:MAG: diaminopimelate decarboxylase [Prevotellaceae bacterium]|jgi:diaminopimelate decarboxylase|nr:diaminopimelate decarboxylase [Prevotellaceae bacterium]
MKLMQNQTLTQKFKKIQTPFYFYDIELLKKTAQTAIAEANKYGYKIHYALKANSNHKILKILNNIGFGADCVSANEIIRAVECGFNPKHIAYAGVGKTDREINAALDFEIFTFNCESLPEIENINKLAAAKGKTADIAIRINPNVDAHTHEYITTGLEENKFGISEWQFAEVVEKIKSLTNINLISLHFHIGSQITDMKVFEALCGRVKEIQEIFESFGIKFPHLNVGGGLGIDYQNPDTNPIVDFKSYFEIFNKNLNLYNYQKLHFELGRAIVAQCGSLITQVVYVKHGRQKSFVIVDGGMSDLIRPALYHAYHKIENLTSAKDKKSYDIVGPICESSDCFAKDEMINEAQRGDILAIRSAGAYGEVMASQYNLRELPKAYYSDEI